MWLMTPFGFFSVVQKPDDKKAATLTIRARVRGDLERLRDSYLPSMSNIAANAGSDYRYRAKALRSEVSSAMAKIVSDIEYANFKDEVAQRQGKVRAGLYGQVWQVLYELPDHHAVGKPTAAMSVKAVVGLKVAYGGVLVDERNRVLLREPKGHYDGYMWTFPKGRPDKGESADTAALREVKEETGYSARIVSKLPGSFSGGTTVNEYFLMVPDGKPGKFDAETASVVWATLDEAEGLIAKTTNPTGRQRDLAVLDAVRSALL
ncbi:MAG: NUDIX hydrolase [Betaproteobacteria bacterium]